MASAELGVQLPPDTSASALLHTMLPKACDHFDDLAHVKLPESSQGFFEGPLFGTRVFETLHDRLNPQAASEDATSCFERQIHGVVYTTRYALIDVFKTAAVIEFARKPSLIAAMARGK